MSRTCRTRRTAVIDPRNQSLTGNPYSSGFVRTLRNYLRHPHPRHRDLCIPRPRAKSLCFVNTIEILIQVELENCLFILFNQI